MARGRRARSPAAHAVAQDEETRPKEDEHADIVDEDMSEDEEMGFEASDARQLNRGDEEEDGVEGVRSLADAHSRAHAARVGRRRRRGCGSHAGRTAAARRTRAGRVGGGARAAVLTPMRRVCARARTPFCVGRAGVRRMHCR